MKDHRRSYARPTAEQYKAARQRMYKDMDAAEREQLLVKRIAKMKDMMQDAVAEIKELREDHIYIGDFDDGTLEEFRKYYDTFIDDIDDSLCEIDDSVHSAGMEGMEGTIEFFNNEKYD